MFDTLKLLAIVARVCDVVTAPRFVLNIVCNQVIKSVQTLYIENKKEFTDCTQALLQNMTDRCSPFYHRFKVFCDGLNSGYR